MGGSAGQQEAEAPAATQAARQGLGETLEGSDRGLTAELAPAARLPDFYIVGHEKCGTTALYLMLSSHPQIFMPEFKEPRFFAQELRSRFRRLGPGKLPNTLEEYARLFADAQHDQLAGEASPVYLRSHTAAQLLAEATPAAKVVAILREPASYLRSFHLQCVHNHTETQRDLAKALALEPKRRQGKRIPPFSQSPPSLLYSDHVRYVEQLKRFHAVLGPEQVLVLIYDDFRRDNQATVRQVLRFLKLDDSCTIEPVETERLKGVRSLRLMQWRFAVSVVRRRAAASGRAVKAVNALIPTLPRTGRVGRLRRRMAYGEPPPPDEALMLELRRRYKGEVVALSEYLGRDLVALWGYDKIP